MKKTYRFIGMVLMAVLVSVGFAACSDDDDDSAGNTKQHKAVDLGLASGTKWADRNMGADDPEDYGCYYAWGETSPKSCYNSENSMTYGMGYSELQSKGIIDSNGNLTASYDAATANWGEGWHMPTYDQIKELVDSCEWKWSSKNDVYGYIVTGKNGNSIFVPAAGRRDGTSLHYAGFYGSSYANYWSSTTYENDYGHAYAMDYNRSSESKHYFNYYARHHGFPVRPVSE